MVERGSTCGVSDDGGAVADEVDVVFPEAAADDDDDDDDDLSRSLAAARVRRLDDGRKDLDTRPQNMAAFTYEYIRWILELELQF